MLNGIINVYKEKGYTSHDVVARLRGIVHQKKIGHSGTLDPDAEGVLPVCFGSATRLCDRIGEEGKTYETVLTLGKVTDTQDSSGTVLETHEVQVTEEEVREAAKSFLGTTMQIPPMYSARKVNGKKLYELAREGIVVERKATPITVDVLTVDAINLPEVRMTISCSKGTYIRTICHDLGAKLGCGACMKELSRTRVGIYTIDRAVRLSEIEALQNEGRIDEVLATTESFFGADPVVHAKDALGDKLISNGNRIPLSLTDGSPEHTEVRMKTSTGRFIGVYRLDTDTECYLLEKMFPDL